MPISTDEQLDATWRQLRIDPAALEVDDTGVLARRQATDDGLDEATDEEPVVTRPEQRVVLGEIIAEGGMGIIHDAEQVSLGRHVAVKSLKPVFADYAGAELLREARITGALEHPNIVPVHALEYDAEARPLIVMKRVVGEPWAMRLDREGDPTLDAAALTRELDVFEQVCNAVAFAHEHGVIHRDIKPDNVVLGRFGEVCLLDWGLAVGVGNSPIADLRPVDTVQGIEGTLPYMAPEQVAGRGDLLGTHTDIYLLGATLYHILAGRAPHRIPASSDDVRAVLLEIFTTAPASLPAWAPSELAVICDRAMARTPGDRFPTALALRDAVIAFRANREAATLAARASRELAGAQARIASGDTEAPEVGRMLAAARFGFEQALRSWTGSHEARTGLQETLLTTARRELDIERPDAASAILDELPGSVQAASSLGMRIADIRAAVSERREAVEALERAAREWDLGQAARVRSTFGFTFGATLLLVHLVMGVGARAGWFAIDHARYLAITTAVTVLFATPALLRRKKLFPNVANRRFAATLAMMLCAEVLLFLGMWHYNISLATTLTLSLVQLAGAVAIKAELLARRARWTALVVLACAVASHFVPRAVFELVGIAYATYFVRGAALNWEDPAGESFPMLGAYDDRHVRARQRARTHD